MLKIWRRNQTNRGKRGVSTKRTKETKIVQPPIYRYVHRYIKNQKSGRNQEQNEQALCQKTLISTDDQKEREDLYPEKIQEQELKNATIQKDDSREGEEKCQELYPMDTRKGREDVRVNLSRTEKQFKLSAEQTGRAGRNVVYDE